MGLKLTMNYWINLNNHQIIQCIQPQAVPVIIYIRSNSCNVLESIQKIYNLANFLHRLTVHIFIDSRYNSAATAISCMNGKILTNDLSEQKPTNRII